MARLQFAAGNGEEGRNYLEKVIAINPSNVSAVKELLLYFREEEMYDETIELVSFLHEYGEYDPFFERYRGKALYENDRLEEAAEAYENALEAFEEDEALLEEAAYANLEAGRKDSGISLLKKLLSLQPDRLDIEERLANLTE
jgi:tetratricopeptide (TPR) repeat protein